MKEVVQRQHSFFREKVKSEKSLKALKRKRSPEQRREELDFSLEDLRFRKSYCEEVNDFLKNSKKSLSNQEGPEKHDHDDQETVAKKSKLSKSTVCYIDKIPEELLVSIFSNLGPRALLNCGAVNKRWKRVAYSSVFWKAIYPTQWARGQWSFDLIAPDLKSDEDFMLATNLSSASSSLYSSVESLSDDHEDQAAEVAADNNQNRILSWSSNQEEKIFMGIGQFLLPKVGKFVSTLILSASKTLTDDHVNLLLGQVPNVRTVNLSYTQISSEAFDGLHRKNALRNLEELILQGCTRVGDSLFASLSRCYTAKGKPTSRSKLRRLNLSGCRSVTSLTLERYLIVNALSLQELDLSGCYKIDGETLTLFVDKCPKLKLHPERLAYCNDIEDGPYPESANGCLNLECELRFCCQKLKN